ncbi:MAG TPA: hypothetical protein VD838_18650, partial [Anaeromyxobacteraceae bacterium]|nr:hypothetical protein [Anaeromyxobacteraceae bacterium]
MSRSLVVVVGITLLSACWQDAPPPDRSRIWGVEVEPGGGEFRLVRGAHVDAVRSDLAEIVRAFNHVMALEIGEDGPGVDDPGPPTLRLRGVRDGVALVEIDNAAHLTQRMGTAGARNFLA